jgi:hypothetical protein
MLSQNVLLDHVFHHLIFSFAYERPLLLYNLPQRCQLLLHLSLMRTILLLHLYLPGLLPLPHFDLPYLLLHSLQLFWHVHIHLTNVGHTLV